MPDIHSVGLGGGSLVRFDPDGTRASVGPDSVGYAITSRALIFGGTDLTASDIAVAAGLTGNFGRNTSVDHLPPTLTYLQLGFPFNKPLDHLPTHLSHLALDGQFNLPIDYLPPYLLSLSIVGDFDRPIDHLPSYLINLRLKARFCQNV